MYLTALYFLADVESVTIQVWEVKGKAKYYVLCCSWKIFTQPEKTISKPE